MNEIEQALLEQHRQMLDRLQQGAADDAFLDSVLAFLDDLRLAGEVVSEAAERSQLRALIHFWCGTLFDYTGKYPTVALLPADVDPEGATGAAPRKSAPPLLWLLAGGASVAVIAAAMVLIGSIAMGDGGGPAMVPEAQPDLRVQYVLAEEGLGGADVPLSGAMVFCRGTSDFVFQFGLGGYQPDTDLKWILRRDGVELTARSAAPYGDLYENLTVRIGPDESDGFLPGRYELALVAGGGDVWVEAFEVLGVAPRVVGLNVSDVPAQSGAEEGRHKFEPGVRVLFLRYTHEGLCSGLIVSHELRRDGQIVQRYDRTWQGQAHGKAEVTFQAQVGTVFAPGEYEIVVSISGEEQATVEFTVLG